MAKKIKVRIVPADPSPESIKNIISVSRVIGGGWSGAQVEVCRLSGTVKEKLAQYKEFFGKEWIGTLEQTYTTYINDKPKNSSGPVFGGVNIAEPLPLSAQVIEIKERMEKRVHDFMAKLQAEYDSWLETREEPSKEEVPTLELEEQL